MRLFLVSSDLAFSLLQAAAEDGWPARGGVAWSGDWPTPDLVLAEESRPFVPVDCFGLNSGADGFVLSAHARDVLEEVLRPVGEFWPVRVFGRAYWWFNCLEYLSALDRNRTEADWGQVAGEWGSFRWITSTRRLAFDRGSLAAVPALFRVPEFPQGALFSGDELRLTIERERLTGFRFDLVWSEAAGGVVDPPGLSLAHALAAEDESEVEARRRDAVLVLNEREDLGKKALNKRPRKSTQ